jgi:hypothetical protein
MMSARLAYVAYSKTPKKASHINYKIAKKLFEVLISKCNHFNTSKSHWN